MWKTPTILGISLLLILSCSLYSMYETETVYLIKEGAHYSTHEVLTYIENDRLEFTFLFDDSAVYSFGEDHEDQADINKLFGFAEGSPANIHRYSARFGWRWYQDRLEILAYCYIDGERESVLMGTAEIGTPYTASIVTTPEAYAFVFNGNEVSIEKDPAFHAERKYLSYPYFGGNMTAPHDISITITTHE